MNSKLRPALLVIACALAGAAVLLWQGDRTRRSFQSFQRAQDYHSQVVTLARSVSDHSVDERRVETTIEDAAIVTRQAQRILSDYIGGEASIARVQLGAPTPIERSAYHRLAGTIGIQAVSPSQAASFLFWWTDSGSVWTPTDLSLVRRSSTRGSSQQETRFDMVVSIEAIVLLDQEDEAR